jgi:demethylmenaquinone methyltransferase/2-methoxy-6-polyprenyl-1,4-benzoquinol methylase
MPLLPDYARQAAAYDTTRAASPSVLAALRNALAGAPGGRLADIGGGSGNYARALAAEGWQPTVVDRSPQMLALAAAKGLPCVEADAQRLPFADASFDAAVLVSMLHHVADPAGALAQARRIVVPGGPVAAMVFTREDIDALWYLDYFPSSRAWMESSHPPLADLARELPGARTIALVYEDIEDASLAALAAHPRLVLEQRWRAQTSYFERLARDHADELAAGLRRLANDVAGGREPRRPGTATVLAWRAR